METIKVSLENAKKIYSTVPEFFKRILEDTFGAKQFSVNIMERIKTFEDALAESNDATKALYQSFDWSQLTPDESAYRKLKIIIKAINQGWEPNWNDSNQKKWYPWFKMSSPSGFGFSVTFYNFTHSGTYVGSRLCFESDEKCKYVATQFIDLYKQFLTI
jgi:hypothetical protein